jgi:hypothetical protein
VPFTLGIRIFLGHGERVLENTLGISEGDSVLPEIRDGLGGVVPEPHAWIIYI